MSFRTYLLAWLLAFAVLEATAALWHLLLFRGYYVQVLSVVDRPFAEYKVPYLMLTNALRAAAVVWFFTSWHRPHPAVTLTSGARFGTLLGAVCGLMVAEYYGIWRINSLSWAFIEGGWAVLQGLGVGLALAGYYRPRWRRAV